LPLRLYVSAILFYDALVLLNLLLIILILGLFLPLHVISDERARAEPHATADCGAQSWPARGGTDQPTGGSTTNRADAGAFFSGG
jgi:hypothetical protein